MSEVGTPRDFTPPRVDLWVCPTCGYWRREKATGVHMADPPDYRRGKPIPHELVMASYFHMGGQSRE